VVPVAESDQRDHRLPPAGDQGAGTDGTGAIARKCQSPPAASRAKTSTARRPRRHQRPGSITIAPPPALTRIRVPTAASPVGGVDPQVAGGITGQQIGPAVASHVPSISDQAHDVPPAVASKFDSLCSAVVPARTVITSSGRQDAGDSSTRGGAWANGLGQGDRT
jgi:hypothetical protein